MISDDIILCTDINNVDDFTCFSFCKVYQKVRRIHKTESYNCTSFNMAHRPTSENQLEEGE